MLSPAYRSIARIVLQRPTARKLDASAGSCYNPRSIALQRT